MVKAANASVTGWIRFLEILESECFIVKGGPLIYPGLSCNGLPEQFKRNLV
jgi:hypothetical protein